MRRLVTVFAFLLAFSSPAEDRASLQAQESELIAQYHRLRAAGLDARTVAQRLHHAIESSALSSDDLQALRRVGVRGEKAELPNRLAPVLANHQAIDAQWSAFHDAYDRFIQAKALYLIRRYQQAADSLARAQPGNDRLQALWLDLTNKAAAFETNVARRAANVGDAARFSDGRHFADAFILFWEQAVAVHRNPWQFVAHQFNRGWRLMRMLAKNVAVLPEIYRAYSRLKANLPVVHTVAPAFERSLWWLGYRQTFRNRAALEEPISGGGVRVLAPNHVHGYLDAAMTAQLPLDRGRIFNAPTFWASPWLTDLLTKNDQFVCVSMGPHPGNPMKAVLQHLDAHRCDTIFIQAEGSLSTGIAYEIRRPADTFASVLSLMRNRGYAVEVVPVSLPRHYRLFGDLLGPRTQTRDLIVEVAQPINPSVVDLLLGSGDPQRFSRLLRQFWLDAAHDEGVAGAYSDRPLGSPLLEPLIALLDSYVVARTACPAALLESALAE